MWMDYSTIEVPDHGVISPCSFYRYLVVLRGGGSFRSGDIHVPVSLHNFFTLPQGWEGRMESDTGKPFLLGSVEIHDHNSTSQQIMVLPEEDTEVARRIFFLGLDVQDCALPYYDTVKAALHQLMFSVLMAAGLQADTINKSVFAAFRPTHGHPH